MKRYLTGMRITNLIHIGNYLGVIPLIQKLSQNDSTFVFVADVHSITNGVIKENPYSLVKLWMYSFQNNSNLHFYLQSDFYEFAHCAWMLACNTSVGDLQRMTQFKSQEDKRNVNSGYLYYPLLMASDILLPRATHVPVGIDQLQHLELTRSSIRGLNKKYGLDFVVPEPVIDESIHVMDLQFPEKKMSKSNFNNKGTIFINDSDDEITRKIQKAVTDSEVMPVDVLSIKNERLGVYNLCNIYRAFSGHEDFRFIESNFGGKRISVFKESLISLLIDKIAPMRVFMSKVSNQEVQDTLNVHKSFVHGEITKSMNNLYRVFFPYNKYL